MKRLLKQAFRRAGYVVARVDAKGAQYLSHPPRGPFEDVLLRVFPQLAGLNFIQVGANDGIRADPIHEYVQRYGWRGVLIEPLPAHFAALRETYAANRDLILINAAVDRQAGQRALFQFRPEITGLPDWTKGLGSFSEARLREAARQLGVSPDAIGTEIVRTITWAEVRSAFGSRSCDLLIIDAEGYDIEILRMAELECLRPRVIHFEHICIERSERLACYAELMDLGYEIATHAGDTVAWLAVDRG